MTESVKERQKFEQRILVASVAGPALNFASAPLLASALGTSGRGTVAAVVSAFFILRYLSTFGGQEAALSAAGWPDLGVAGAARATSRWIFPISVVVTLIAFGAAPLIFPRDAAAVDIFRAVVLLVPIAAVSDGQRFALTADRQWRPIVAQILLPRVVRVVGALIMVLAVIDSPAVGSAVSVVGVVLGAIAVMVAVRRIPGPRELSSEVERKFRRFAAQLGPGQLARLGNRRLDQILLAAVAGSSQLGIYAVAVALAEVADLPTRTVRQIAMRSVARSSGPEIHDYFRAGLLLFVPAALALGLALPVVLWLIFPASFFGALWPGELLLVGGVANYVKDVLGVSLVTSESAKLESSLQLITLGVAVVAVLVLGSVLGAVGAAVAALISYTVGAILIGVWFLKNSPGVDLKSLVPRRSDLAVAKAMVFAR